jgi:hypothetical protein
MMLTLIGSIADASIVGPVSLSQDMSRFWVDQMQSTASGALQGLITLNTIGRWVPCD